MTPKCRDEKCIYANFLLKEAGLSIWNMDNFHFFKGIFVIFMWKWGGRMQRIMSWISYNFAKLLKKRIICFSMHLQLMKKIIWSIFFDHLLIVLIGTKNMEMWLIFILLIRWMFIIYLLVFLLASTIMKIQFSLVVHFFKMK